MKKWRVDKKVVEFIIEKPRKLVYLIIYPEMASETNFENFIQSFIEVFEKKYLRNLAKNEQEIHTIWQYKEKVAEDLNMILSDTDFSGTDKTNKKKKKWEMKDEQK